jgi:hypothetical protein
LYGDVNGRALRAHQYERERTDVARIIARNAGHPALAEAEGLLVGIIRSAPGYADTFRSDWGDVTAKYLLEHVASVYVYAARKEFAELYGDRLALMLGFAAARFVPRKVRDVRRYRGAVYRQPREIPARMRKYIGRSIVGLLSPFLVNIQQAIQKREEDIRERRRKLGMPLERRQLPRDPTTGRIQRRFTTTTPNKANKETKQ